MKNKKRMSLSLKVNLLIICSILLVSAGLVWISYYFYGQKIRSLYYEQVNRAANSVKEQILPLMAYNFWNEINTDEFREIRTEAIAANNEDLILNWMISRPSFMQSHSRIVIDLSDAVDADRMTSDHGFDIDEENLHDDYETMLEVLLDCMESFDISAAYLQYDENGITYNLADPVENLFYIGSIEEPIEAFADYTNNDYVPPTIYRSEFGWLSTSQLPLNDTPDGKPAGYVGIDADMNQVVAQQRQFLMNSSIYILVLTVVVILFSVYLLNRIIVRPLKLLAGASADFANNDDELTKENVIQLPIRANDEVGDLYQQFRNMQTRIVDYTDRLSTIIAERERVRTELHMAENIQRGMLQSEFPAFPERCEFDLHASMIPAKEVGGDFYDFYLMDDSHLALLIADVSDKGVPAALFMMSAMNLIRYRSLEGGTPGEILSAVNSYLCKNNSTKMFVTVWMGILDLNTGIMTCANAGHEYPFIREAGKNFQMLRDRHGLVIGGLPNTQYKEYELKLEPGAAVFVYTDGIPEARSAEGKFYGMNRLGETLNRSADGTAGDIIRLIKADVDAFTGDAKQFDDMTMLCIEYKGSEK